MILALASAQSNHDLLWASVIASALAFIGVILTSILARVNRREDKKEILGQLDTGNHHTIGESNTNIQEKLHTLAQTMEFLTAQGHTNSQELLTLHEQHEEMRESQHQQGHILEAHLRLTAPLIDWVEAKRTKERLKERNKERG